MIVRDPLSAVKSVHGSHFCVKTRIHAVELCYYMI
jgi:hypothetical protein